MVNQKQPLKTSKSIPPTSISKDGNGKLTSQKINHDVSASSISDVVNQDSASNSVINTDDVVLKIKVLRARNIRGSKGEKVSSLVRVQFADFDYRDSEMSADNPNPEFNFAFDQVFHEDEAFIDMIINKKISITLIEMLPKEKTATLGTAESYLSKDFVVSSPNAPATTFMSRTLPIVYQNPKLLVVGKTSNPEEELRNPPEFDLEVSLSRPLISPEVFEAGNFLNIKVADIFPVPEEWSLKEGNDKDLNSNIHTYNLNFQMPSESSSNRLISIQNGTLQLSSEPPSTDGPNLTTITQPKPTPEDQPNDNAAATNTTTNDTAQTNPPPTDPSQAFKKCIWNCIHRVWMPPKSVAKFREQIAKKQPMEIELSRVLQPKFVHVQDPSLSKYRGKITIDCTSLLYPRVIGLKGRFSVETPDDLQKSDSPYKAGTTIGIQITVDKPLLDKSKLQPITKSVQDFIPRRVIPSHLLYEKQSQKVEEEYKSQMEDVVRKLANEYYSLLIKSSESEDALQDEWENNMELSKSKTDLSREGSKTGSQSLENEVMKRKKFMYHLNKSGMYFNLKEQLKSAVVEVVREKFRKKSPFTSKPEMQLFLNEIYVYLVDQMHTVILKMFREKNSLAPDFSKSILNNKQLLSDQSKNPQLNEYFTLKKFAELAEFDQNFEVAGKYHQERIAKFEDSMQVWFDYACFCMRNRMVKKGEECFKLILSRQPKHVPSLLAYGGICANNDKYEEARVYLVTASELQPKYIVAITILGLFYELIGEEIESEGLISNATKLHKTSLPSDSPSIFITAADFLIHIHAGRLAEMALSHEILTTGPKIKPNLMLSQLEIQRGNYAMSLSHVNEALEIQKDNPDVWTMLGHLQYVQKEYTEAQFSFETVLSLPHESSNITQVYDRLGAIYLKSALEIQKSQDTGSSDDVSLQEKYTQLGNQSRSMFLRSSQVDPTSSSWVGVGKACIVLGEYEEAEDALSEANVLNNRDCDVWGYISLLCLAQNRMFEANQAISQALKLGIKNVELLKQIAVEFIKINETASAIECLRMCMELHSDSEGDSSCSMKEIQDLFVQVLDTEDENDVLKETNNLDAIFA